MTSGASYLRFPTVRDDVVAFVAEDEVWAVDRAGGRAWPVTADRAPVAFTRLSPDGTTVAFTSRRDGLPEVHVADLAGGGARRLTYWGDEVTRVLGWLDDDHVVAATPAGQMSRWVTWAYAVPVAGGPARRLPLGPVSGWTTGPDGAVVVATDGNRRGAAAWKRYRGGTIGRFWLDTAGDGDFERFLADVDGQLEDPVWTGGRLAFLSDHEGWGNVYSVAADGSDLRRHTDHADRYARALSGDGTRLVHAAHGDLYLLDDLGPTSQPRRLDVVLPSARTARRPAPVPVAEALGDVAVDRTGRAAAVEVRGTVQWLTTRDGPVRAVADTPGVRVRLPQVVPSPAAAGGPPDHGRPLVLRVTDAEGDDALEIGPADGSTDPRRLAAGEVGRVLELAASPDGRLAAVATHDGRLLLVDLADPAASAGSPVVVVDGLETDVSGLAFSPDSRWLAWSHPGAYPLRQVRLAELGPDGPRVVEATPLRFVDTEPRFTDDGLHLAFLSVRTFDPVYDAMTFDMAFLAAQRPYLLPLAATTPSPLAPSVDGRPTAEAPAREGADAGAPPTVVVDAEGITARAVPLPVPGGRYEDLQVAAHGLLWREPPLAGELGESRSSGDEPMAPLRRFDLRTRRTVTLADKVRGAWVSGDGSRVLVRDDDGLRLLPADRVVPEDDSDAVVKVDLGRARVVVDPAATWRQMFEEQGRLMRDHFWVPDLAGVAWEEVLERYRPLVERVATRDDLSEVLWETVGELGTSHAYETPPPRPVATAMRLGHLGADLDRDDDGTWRVSRILPGEPSVTTARSPLLAPGVGVAVGDALVAVDGRPVDPATGPAPLLVGTASRPTELTVVPAGGGEPRRVAVVPLTDERPVRYHDWVGGRRRAVHEATGGRVGYLHVPDMVASGWAQLHRDLHTEVRREALVLDLRANAGGHLSELVLEKLARRIRARSVSRHAPEETWPSDAPRGPLVCVTNQWAGSDGDIGTSMFRALGLGPVVGMRTWGGVVGIDGRYTLVDGTAVTQPRYGFWTTAEGWGVENHGVAPDVEVPHPPQAWAAGEDPQLDTAVGLVLEALQSWEPVPEPDWRTRPDRAAPALPPRP